MEQAQQWFNNLPRREQQLLLVCGGLLLVFVFVKLIWQPIDDSRSTLKQRNIHAQDELVTVRALAAEYNTLKKSGSNSTNQSTVNLPQLVNASVRRNQLKLKRLQPSSTGDVQVRFENMPFNSIIAWLHDIEVDNGVIVKDISINPGSTAGLVSVSVRVRKG